MTDVLASAQLLTVACEDLLKPKPAIGTGNGSTGRTLSDPEAENLRKFPVPTAAGNVINLGSQR